MAKKRALGRGLGALIPERVDTKKENNYSESTDIKTNNKNENKTKTNKNTESKDKIVDDVLSIKIDQIKVNEDNARKTFNQESIDSLGESIKLYGVLQPLVLIKREDHYEIVAGERRFRAAKSVGLKEVPAIIKDLSKKDKDMVALIENIQREDLNSIEEALAYKKLINDFNLTQEELSKRIGKSRVTITNTLRLLNLSEDVQQYIIEGVISEGHGRALLGITDSKVQCELAQSVIDDKLSVRELEILIRKLKTSPTRSKSKSSNETNPYYKDITYKLENYFGTKVNITNKNNKGKIEIEYYSEEDLQRILEIINL